MQKIKKSKVSVGSLRSVQRRMLPSAKAVMIRPSAPVFGQGYGSKMNGAGGNPFVTIKRRELVGTITNANATAGFVLVGNSNNVPGYDASITCGTMFPWGSQIGFAYEKFRFQKLKLTLVSSQPTTASGRVYIAFDPDWSDDVQTTKAGLMGLQCSVDASVWDTVELKVPFGLMNSSMEWRFCSPTTRTFENEPRTAYAGFFILGVDSPTANCIWDLWVDYEVDLMEPTSENFGPAVASEDKTAITLTQSNAGTISYAMPTYTSKDAPLEIVSAFNAKIPSTINAVPVSSAIKIPSSGPATGNLELSWIARQAAKTPATLIGTDGLTMKANVYDGVGALLGELANLSGDRVKTGVKLTGDLNTAGADATGGITVPLKVLKDQWPTVSTIVPFIQAATPILLDFLRSSAAVLI